MDVDGIRFDPPNVESMFTGIAARTLLARMLRRWTDRRRPAILFVLVGEAPFADVYAEDDLLEIFPNAGVSASEPASRDDAGTFRVFVAEERGTTIHVVADPRGSM